jgi:hypothetical protein
MNFGIDIMINSSNSSCSPDTAMYPSTRRSVVGYVCLFCKKRSRVYNDVLFSCISRISFCSSALQAERQRISKRVKDLQRQGKALDVKCAMLTDDQIYRLDSVGFVWEEDGEEEEEEEETTSWEEEDEYDEAPHHSQEFCEQDDDPNEKKSETPECTLPPQPLIKMPSRWWKEDKLSSQTSTTSTSIVSGFPWRLHDMLGEAERKGFENAVSWQPCGRAFRVHDTKVFAEFIMPRYFNQTQYKSFQRQLNIYGFRRVTTDAGSSSKGGYTHDLFIRGKPDICRFMVRTKVKTKGSRSDSFGCTGKRKMVILMPKPI